MHLLCIGLPIRLRLEFKRKDLSQAGHVLIFGEASLRFSPNSTKMLTPLWDSKDGSMAAIRRVFASTKSS
jgi:hypothetical protein